MKYLKTFEKSIIEIEQLINDIKNDNLKILKSNRKYTISKGNYIYEFSKLIDAIPVDRLKEYKGDGYSYEFSIFKFYKGKYNKTSLKSISTNEIDKKYWNEVKSIYDMRNDVNKYNL